MQGTGAGVSPVRGEGFVYESGEEDIVGEAKTRQTATQKLIAIHPFCPLCGGRRRSTTREHCPPIGLFLDRQRPDDFVVPSCIECQNQTRTADLVASIISRWTYSDYEEFYADHSRLLKGLRIRAPEIINEWTSLGLIDRKKARRKAEEKGIFAPNNNIVLVGPVTIPHLNVFSAKFVLAAHFVKSSKLLDARARCFFTWHTKETIQRNEIPKEIGEMLGPSMWLQQGSKETRISFEYRYSYNQQEGVFAIMARFNGSFIGIGFVVEDASRLENSDSWWECSTAIEKAAELRTRVKAI